MGAKRILIINGSLGGRDGNTGTTIDCLARHLSSEADLARLDLQAGVSLEKIKSEIASADGFVFATGVYWDTWGSPLQRFFEDLTSLEAGELWLGKPAAVIVTMHSVGGKEVLSRLQGVLSTLGLLIPPMSAMAYSLANQLALGASTDDHANDLWCLDDLETIAKNLLTALTLTKEARWQTWPVDRSDPSRRWITV